MKVIIGSDHGGFNLKKSVVEHLEGKGIEVKDAGPFNLDSVD